MSTITWCVRHYAIRQQNCTKSVVTRQLSNNMMLFIRRTILLLTFLLTSRPFAAAGMSQLSMKSSSISRGASALLQAKIVGVHQQHYALYRGTGHEWK